jgi:uncharacterized membrane protein
LKLSNVKEYVVSRLWTWPMVGLLITFLVAGLTLYADAELGDRVDSLLYRSELLTSDPDTARAMLTVISGAMVSLLVFSFTMTMVVIQLASAQYSPRLMRSVLRDRPTKMALALFICTFAYSMLVLRAVVDQPGAQVVPELSLAVTYLLVLASLFTFVAYINHIAHSLRVGTVIARVTDETAGLIEQIGRRAAGELRKRPTQSPEDHPSDARDVGCPHSGSISHIDEEELLRLATERDLVIELAHRVGDHVPRGAALARVRGRIDDDELTPCISLAQSRTLQQDIAYGLRQLVDIASRALSPGVNDATTAVQCLDGLHDLLRRLLEHPELPEVLVDDDGVGRLIIPRATWADHVALAITEIRIYGAGSPQIPRRLEAMLRDLHGAAAPHQRPVLERELRLLEAQIDREVELPEDRAMARRPDEQGLGTAGPH